jgi:hypothetical protein
MLEREREQVATACLRLDEGEGNRRGRVMAGEGGTDVLRMAARLGQRPFPSTR